MGARMMLRQFSLLSITLLIAGLPALAAETHKVPAHPVPAGPKSIGKFDDWTAATHEESGQTVCYAFTRAQSSSPAEGSRNNIILTVTERPALRDTVAIDAGFTYAANAAVTVQVDQTGLEFYTSGRDAFAREGKAAVAAFTKGSRAIARSPGPKGVNVTDTFSLKGFGAAYAAIVKACPVPQS
jgi:invasion protein IalB